MMGALVHQDRLQLIRLKKGLGLNFLNFLSYSKLLYFPCKNNHKKKGQVGLIEFQDILTKGLILS